MKKLITCLLALTMTFALTACGGSSNPSTPPSQSSTPPLTNLTEWPTDEITQALGAELPAFEGDADNFSMTNTSVGAQKVISVTVSNPSITATEYELQLSQDGYTVDNDGYYRKTLDNGDYVQVFAQTSYAQNPTTYETEPVLIIQAIYNKTSGEYTSWSSLDLSSYRDASLPAYSGGTSYDLTDVGSETIQQELSSIQAAIDILAAYESLLDEEDKAELAALRAKIPYIQQIKAHTVTVYGTDETEVSAYENALTAAGFAYGEKQTEDYLFCADVGSVDSEGKVVVTLQRIPIQLVDEGESGGGSSSVSLPYTMPENIKISYTVSYSEYTVIKIGDDYYSAYGMSGYYVHTYYKKTGNVWEVYEKDIGETEWVKQDYQETDELSVQRATFDFVVTQADIDDEATKNGTTTIAEREAEIYLVQWSYGGTTVSESYYKDVETGLLLQYTTSSGGTISYVVTLFDTTVVSFGVTLP